MKQSSLQISLSLIIFPDHVKGTREDNVSVILFTWRQASAPPQVRLVGTSIVHPQRYIQDIPNIKL